QTARFASFAKHIPLPWNTPYQLAYAGVTFVSILGCVLATRSSLRTLTKDFAFSQWACLLIVYMAYFSLILPYGLNYTLPYDAPSLFFFSLCISLIIRRKLLLYYPCFILAVFNRETICFVTLFFLIWEFFRVDGR